MLNFDMKAARIAWTITAIPLLLGGIYVLRRTLLLFVIALMFAYLLHPLVEAIDRRLAWKMPARTLALVLPFLLVLGGAVSFGMFVGKQLGGEATQLAAQLKSPDFSQHLREWRPMNLPVGEQIGEHYSDLLGIFPAVGKTLIAASNGIIDAILIPILSFFMLKDGGAIHRCVLGFFPAHKLMLEHMLADAHRLMLAYMRALFLLCLTTLISFSIGLSVMHVPHAILLAVISFPLELIPLAGPLAGAVVILGVCGFSGCQNLLSVVAFLGGYRMFQDYVVSPHLMSRGIRVHPLLVMFGVFAGFEMGGVAGAFLSVPILALARLVYCEAHRWRAVSRAQLLSRCNNTKADAVEQASLQMEVSCT